MRRRSAAVVAVTIASAGLSVAAPQVARSASGPTAVYVSTSGVSHHDIADVATLRAGRGWDPGDPNSISPSWDSAIDTVWDEIGAQMPTAVFTTGDMVEGRWGQDPDHTGIFGPVDTFRHRKAAVRHAGWAYLGEVVRRAQARGLTVLPGMGDHEIGDIGSSGITKASEFKARAIDAWLTVWQNVNGHTPYYTTTLPGDVQLWTLRPFMKMANGEIHARIDPQQVSWLTQTLSESTATYRLVQTEIPPYPGEYAQASSRLVLENADELWSLFEKYDVDVVLGAEFHRVNARLGPDQLDMLPHTPVEIIHGGRLPATANYLTIAVYPDRLEIESHTFYGRNTDCTHVLWAPGTTSRPCVGIALDGPGVVTGSMTISSGVGVSNVDAHGDLALQSSSTS